MQIIHPIDNFFFEIYPESRNSDEQLIINVYMPQILKELQRHFDKEYEMAKMMK